MGIIIPKRKNPISASACFILTLLITKATGQPRITMPRRVRTATIVLFKKYLGIADMVSALIKFPR
ncbi:MAG: hypothetical protein ACLRMZ_07125 [Blautia marasmi]